MSRPIMMLGCNCPLKVGACQPDCPHAREEAPAEGAGELDKAVKRMRDQLVGSATFTSLSFGREDVRLVLDTLSTLRNRTSEPEAGAVSAHKVEWVNDARNVNDRRMYIDGQQWAKVYGWDEVSLNARCDALQVAMQHSAPETADKLKMAVEALEKIKAIYRKTPPYHSEAQTIVNQALAAMNEQPQ